MRTNVQACERIISFNFPIDDPPISVISNTFPVGVNLTFPPSRLQPPRRPEACDRGPVHIGHRACVSAMAAVWRHRPTAPSAGSGEIDRDGARPHAIVGILTGEDRRAIRASPMQGPRCVRGDSQTFHRSGQRLVMIDRAVSVCTVQVCIALSLSI